MLIINFVVNAALSMFFYHVLKYALKISFLRPLPWALGFIATWLFINYPSFVWW